jgi:hypothetical protein
MAFHRLLLTFQTTVGQDTHKGRWPYSETWNVRLLDARENCIFGQTSGTWILQVSNSETEVFMGSVWKCQFTPWERPFRRQHQTVKSV